jgi:hypothetical protein
MQKLKLIIILIIVITIIIVIVIIRSISLSSPTTPYSLQPTTYTPLPTPTLIPLHFTGGDISQDLPPDIKLLSEQKTKLRKKTPLTLPFGDISFDYTNDTFILLLNEPKDQSQTAFNAWLKQTYPAIPGEQFAIR